MSVFGGLILTNKGRNLLIKGQLGAVINYTRIAIGDGSLSGSSILDLTALKNEVKSLPITKLRSLTGGRFVVGTIFSNNDIISGFYYRELGLFAQDPDLGEILYCYGNAGTLAEYITTGGGADLIEKAIDIEIIVGNASSVTATIDSSLVYATYEDLAVKVDKVTGKQLSTNDYTTIEKDKLAEVASNANNYVHPTNHSPSIISQDINNRFVSDTEKTAWNAKETPAGAQAKVDTHSGDTTKHITGAERTSWNSKATSAQGIKADNAIPTSQKGVTGGVALFDTVESQLADNVTYVTKFSGVDKTGVSDSTVGIQNAINATTGILFFPKGVYKITSTITISTTGITLKGEGQNKSILSGTITASEMFKATVTVKFDNLFLLNLSTTSSRTLSLATGEAHIIDSCNFQNTLGNIGEIIYYQGANTKIRNCNFNNYEPNAYCIRSYASTSQININTEIIGCYLGGSGLGILIDSVDSIRRPEGIKINGNTILLTGTEQITIKSAYFVDISHNIIDVATNLNISINPEKSGVSGVVISNNYFGNNAPYGQAIGFAVSAVGALNTTISDNYFGACGYAVMGGANVNGIIIKGNQFASIGQTSLTFNQSKNVVISDNIEGTTGFSLSLADGAGGGSFLITNNKFVGTMDITKTTVSKFKILSNVGLADTFIVQAISGGNKMQSGTNSLSVVTAGVSVFIAITFPVAFATIPKVITSSAPAKTETYNTSVAWDITTTGFTLYYNSGMIQTSPVTWIAIGS